MVRVPFVRPLREQTKPPRAETVAMRRGSGAIMMQDHLDAAGGLLNHDLMAALRLAQQRRQHRPQRRGDEKVNQPQETPTDQTHGRQAPP